MERRNKAEEHPDNMSRPIWTEKGDGLTPSMIAGGATVMPHCHLLSS